MPDYGAAIARATSLGEQDERGRRDQGRPAVAAARRYGEAGRHAQGRRKPPGPVGRGRRGAQPARLLGQGPRLRGLHRRDRQSLRAARRLRPQRAAGDERFAHGQPADRRPLRRNVWRAGSLRGTRSTGGCRGEDASPRGGRRLDQRGRLAFPAGRHGLGRVRGPQRARRDARGQGLEGRPAEGRSGRDVESCARADAPRQAGLRARRLCRSPYRAGPAAGE